MLFYVGWQPRAGQGAAEQKKTLEVFSRWKPPKGVDIKAFYGRVDGCGFAVVHADSAEALYTATSPWAGVYLDYEIVPIVLIEKAVEILNAGATFRGE